ncbi:DUF2528 family protein [Shewanella algae]|uniref:DUF2528 family protein n=1 Tax=Shewanella algae TaxID=38313 RepID=UPI001AAF8017|nr:DUF2528 family protein [Shewanella algae]MBO2698134.1 DUF2528 family protein [Shewanella algae]
MGIRIVKFNLDQWDISSELTLEVDEDKFTHELAEEINNFWSDDDYRINQCDGSVIDAALRLYAVECFTLIAFNNFKDEDYVMAQFDWSKGRGIEGFHSFQDAGLVLKDIENWHIEFEHVQLIR